MKTVILSWLQNDGSRGFSVDQLKGNNFRRCYYFIYSRVTILTQFTSGREKERGTRKVVSIYHQLPDIEDGSNAMRLVKGVWKKLPQLGIEPQTSHFLGECANQTALSTLPYTSFHTQPHSIRTTPGIFNVRQEPLSFNC